MKCSTTELRQRCQKRNANNQVIFSDRQPIATAKLLAQAAMYIISALVVQFKNLHAYTDPLLANVLILRTTSNTMNSVKLINLAFDE